MDVIANPRVPRWAVASAILAPVGMIGGWTLAASLQPTFDPVRETISALAASSATAPEVMTAGLALTGLAHMVTAAGLRPARGAGRMMLGVGGLATAVVAMAPVDAWPRAHGVAAAVAFVALSTWPAAAWSPRGGGALRPRQAVAATVGLVGLLVWFGLELQRVTSDAGATTGLAERALAGAQSLWPLVVVLTAVAGRTPVAGHAQLT
ncbi:MAG: DUF998 domain-containing protein [Cellulomonas sp.]|uniref:DUF998 domain-containing protein n=1 Tax=Cellulomonas sp. TaxID=40001 RepID=UPI0017EB2722|nr:DUF998 domain-containing protein [Cellulomonas sp.]NMM31693.1 DUF998 domain-containing protein [Cellulomonas sp.]